MSILANWIEAGLSGSVVGAAGIGKSNLLGFLCHRPDALRQYLAPDTPPAALIPVDLNNLPADDTATLYRVILRSFHESSGQFEAPMQEVIATQYLENRTARDPFLPHSALRELVLALQQQQIQVVLVLDRFDRFCQDVAPEMTDTLRGLRDSFKETICYIAGMRQEVSYLSNPAALGELYELLDTNICWVQPMGEADVREMIAGESSGGQTPSEDDICHFLELSGGHPALLKAAFHWWRNNPARPGGEWPEFLLETPSIQHRLEKIWHSLTLSEQEVLGVIQKQQLKPMPTPGARQTEKQATQLEKHQQKTAYMLNQKGLIAPAAGDRWQIGAALLNDFVGQTASHSPGPLWLDRPTGILYQGNKVLDSLSPLESGLLSFLVRHPRTRHTHTGLIEAVWPDDMNKEGVSTEALYQVVRGLRRKIEPAPSQPHYIVNWRGSPEGGYQCFPEGRPG